MGNFQQNILHDKGKTAISLVGATGRLPLQMLWDIMTRSY